MALMAGSGPFSRKPAGTFNFPVDAPAHQLYLEPTPRRLRVVVAEQVIADSTAAMLLHETGLMPVYYVPLADVRRDVLEPTDHQTHCPFKGDASYWSIRVGDEVRENAVWSYPEPLDGAPALAGFVAFYFDAVDAWFEEAERIVAHPRDPYHRVDVVSSDRHVTVRVGERVIAESRHPTMVFETSLPVRTYLPADDVDLDRLEPSDTRTVCPYKGRTTRYFSIRADDGLREDAVWAYDDPRPVTAGLAGLLAFDDDQVTIDVEVDRFTV